MFHRIPLILLAFAPVFAQTTAQPSAMEDPVVAVVEGRDWRRSELEAMMRAMGGNIATNYYNDKRTFLQTFGLLVKLSALAEKDGLDKQEPHSWRLYYNRLMYLANVRSDAQVTRSLIMPEDQKKYFEEHKDEFSEAKVRVLYLTFNDKPPQPAAPNVKKPRTSAEARALAEIIVKQARAGADFGKLVAQYSDDAESKAKNGEFPPIKPADQALSPNVKAAVFALKPGQVSDPISQPNGIWIFRLDEFVFPSYDQVRDDIYKRIQDERFRAWMEDLRTRVSVEFKDPKYLDEKAPMR